MYPFPVGAGGLQVVVKHRVANVDVDTLCKISGTCASCKDISLIVSSHVLEQQPVLSGAEPSGEPKFEDGAGVSEPSKEVRIASSALAMKTDGIHKKQEKLGCRHSGQEIIRKPVKHVV